MLLPTCPNGKCRCWCGLLAGEPQKFESDRRILSRFTELAACNDTPLDLDKQLCRSMLDAMHEDLQTLNDHIEGLERVLSALKAVREKNLKLMREHCSILNPIRSLPTEILSKIFCDASPSVDFTERYRGLSSLDTSTAPWTLAKVSARWRQIALSTPRLWSTIAVTEYRRGWNDTCSPSLLWTQLQLSRSSPLTIVISWGQTVLSSSLMEMLLPSSPRWETLLLFVKNFHPQFRCIKGKLPSLRNLLCDVHKSQAAVSAGVFAAAPKLRTLSIPGFDYLPYLSHLPFSQITTLSTIYEFSTSGLSRLASFTALQQCTLLISDKLQLQKDTVVPFILPNLRILHVELGYHAGQVLEMLTLPALEILSIGKGSLTNQLSRLLWRSQCILKELRFGSYVDIRDTTTVFEQLPSLEKLTSNPGLGQETVAVLARRTDLLPSLQVLHLPQWGREPDMHLLQLLKDTRPGLELVIRGLGKSCSLICKSCLKPSSEILG